MAAGLGFKTFTTGDVLTAGDTNGYLMQGVWVFADAAARTAAVASPQEGNISYLKDTNSTEYYSGSAWVAIGGASGSYTSLATGTLSGPSTTISTISGSYKKLVLVVDSTYGTVDENIAIRLNGDSGSNYASTTITSYQSTVGNASPATYVACGVPLIGTSVTNNSYIFQIEDYTSAKNHGIIVNGAGLTSGTKYSSWVAGTHNATAAVTSITMFPLAGSWSGGNYVLYGVK